LRPKIYFKETPFRLWQEKKGTKCPPQAEQENKKQAQIKQE
jgi:hypothetical protein